MTRSGGARGGQRRKRGSPAPIETPPTTAEADQDPLSAKGEPHGTAASEVPEEVGTATAKSFARPGPAETKPPQLVRRNRALALGLAAVVAASAVSWLAGGRIRSPAEIAARTAPPTPSLISIPVEKRLLSADVVVRGTVRYGAPRDVLLPVSALKKSSGIITTAATKGKELNEGTMALTVSGRPVFVLQGAQPAYRDLGPGARGEDVRQLEASLARLGFRPGPEDGVFDGATAAAVAAWYLRAGSDPLGPTEEQLQLLRAQQTDSIAAQGEVLGAQQALAVARRDVVLAEQRAAVLRGLAPGTLVAPGLSPAEAAARARVEQERVAAAVRLANARRALDRATEAERVAHARLEDARTRQPPPSNEEYAALSKEARDASQRVGLARDELTVAQEAAAVAGSPTDPAAGTTGPDHTLLRDTRLDATTASAEIDKAQSAVAFAQRRVGLLSGRTQFSSATKLGIHVPADEVLFFPSLPLRVDEVKRQPGMEALGPIMTVTNSRLVVESAIAPNDAKLVREGAPVSIRAPDLGIDVPGTVSRMATSPGTNGVDPQRFYLEVTPTDIAASLLGASVVQTIAVESTEGEVLAVPVAGLSVAADGATRVQVQRPGGRTGYVIVTPGLVSKGLVEVTPLRGDLQVGDLIVVGRSGVTTERTKAKGSRGR